MSYSTAWHLYANLTSLSRVISPQIRFPWCKASSVNEGIPLLQKNDQFMQKKKKKIRLHILYFTFWGSGGYSLCRKRVQRYTYIIQGNKISYLRIAGKRPLSIFLIFLPLHLICLLKQTNIVCYCLFGVGL